MMMMMMMMTIRAIIITILISAISLQADGSAIPMWEFLSRDEKMTHLYRVFDKQAKDICQNSLSRDCYTNILLNGLQNLIRLDEYTLDTLDPYQRDAKSQIWRALVGGKPIEKRIDDIIKNFDDNNVDSLDTSDSANDRSADESSSTNDYLNPTSYEGSYPAGPYIIRVYPDGRPVPNNSKQPKPYDDDLDELIYYHRSPITEIPTNNG